MKKEQLFISTTASDATVRCKIEGISNRVLHAPFNELFPCAIDLKARSLAAYRYRQATELAKRYGSTKVIVHGDYFKLHLYII